MWFHISNRQETAIPTRGNYKARPNCTAIRDSMGKKADYALRKVSMKGAKNLYDSVWCIHCVLVVGEHHQRGFS